MLAPDEQMLVDFGKLIRNQVPDKNGHVLPPDLTSGAYRLRDLEHNPLGALYEGKVIVDKTYGHAAYGCGVCCGPDAPVMAFDPLAVSIDDYADQQVQALNSCGGGVQDFTDDFSTWWTGDTAIATANKNSIHGVAAGTTNHYAESDPMYWGIRKAFNSCPISRPQTTAGTKVQVPTSLHVVSSSPIPLTNVAGCLATDYGIAINIHYQVLDQNGGALQSSAMIPQEKLLNESFNGDPPFNPFPNWVNIAPNSCQSSSSTDANGQFCDGAFATCASVAFTETSTQPIAIVMNGVTYTVRTSNWTSKGTAPGHGSVTSGVDVTQSN
jgi:hypothetical protein